MTAYVEYEFYANDYLNGKQNVIDEKDFSYWAFMASAEIARNTFNRIDTAAIPDEARYCCCEIAEKLCAFEKMKDDSGRILQSYGNDGETGTYMAGDMTENAVNNSIHKIIRKWLGNTGLLYCGV
ncbi:Uncharacterised protein [[Eubacterium] contortum]|uniref:Phage gp6-like head-tail connector protein n=1 Tax=Faecalicatena contorta TaxID=39482 RepID=A0A174L8T6_9FIRM|nr:hypothetical protein [Faecalicatena contorta]CUP20682.1 Uncharacterised protein [[Eubacterium] contortum] [Faecalicatena contorta]